MAKGKGICDNGKSYLIDPNELFGHDTLDNVFVPPEDLNIYVELTTSKKSRSILDVTDNGLVGISSEKGKSKVSFIDGSDNGEVNKDGTSKKSLTTSYTELTTVFNKTADTEKFGITDIDINFNSAYAPLIRIQFVDIRGASLFNSGNPPNSEYSSFFDLPYPIFELTIKGYYGKPVKYCLHLTKWNAKFNAKTGNFEITADFIGYTYALLTDMLLGYLRAITETERGMGKFIAAKEEMVNENELITINQLLTKIADVNEAITKLQSDDNDIKELALNKEAKTAIDGLENALEVGIQSITKPNVSTDSSGYTIVNNRKGLIGVRHETTNDETEASENLNDIINFKESMVVRVEKLNETIKPPTPFNVEEFSDVRTSQNFIYNQIFSGDTDTNIKQTVFRNGDFKLKDDEKFQEFKETLDGSIRNGDKDKNMDIFDFTRIVDKIKEVKDNLESGEVLIKEAVALKLKDTFVDVIGFEPSIKNIFRIFTIHAEIFIECLKDVSSEAEGDINGLRRGELEKLKEDFDINRSDTTATGSLPPKIYPWPLFRKPKNDEDGVLEENWLGESVNINENVPELVFVEELLDGLLKVGKEDSERQSRINNSNVIVNSWYPINVLDTPLFGVVQNPYKTTSIGLESNNPTDPLKLVLMRAFTFLGVSNRYLLPEEIKTMAILEANTCNEGLVNESVKLSLIKSTDTNGVNADTIIETFLNGQEKSSGKRKITINSEGIKDKAQPLMYDNGTYYNYKYIESGIPYINGVTSSIPFIPFNGNFDGSEFYNNGTIKSPNELLMGSELRTPNGSVFLASHVKTSGTGIITENTGAIYMKIFSEDEYNSVDALSPDYIRQNESIQALNTTLKSSAPKYLDSGSLYKADRNKEGELLGWNILGDDTSRFAFTTVKNIDFNNQEGGKAEKAFPLGKLENAPLKSLFYVNQEKKFGATSLSRRLKDEHKPELNSDETRVVTINNTEIEYYGIRYSSTRRLGYLDNFHPNLGNTRDLFEEQTDVMIPHCDFVVEEQDNSNESHIYSLFGSQLYFEQRQSSSPKAAKALLFLHTFPWNQLYTDDVDSIDNGGNASIFDNAEGDTISNLFNRKSAFLNAPYLWCAFMGGILWRFNESDIIYEDSQGDFSGLVPSYKGGSGEFDPIIWGSPDTPTSPTSDFLQSYIPEFNKASRKKRGSIPADNKYPERNQFLTHWQANAPMSFGTDGEYKLISKVIRELPVQVRLEFRRIFFEFVNSDEWRQIREAYEIQDPSWDLPDTTTNITYNVNGSNNGTWVNGSKDWTDKWDLVTKLDASNIPSTADNLIWNKPSTSNVNRYRDFWTFNGVTGVKKSVLDTIRNLNNFEYLQPIRVFVANAKSTKSQVDVKYNYDMAFRGEKPENTIMVELLRRGVWIANVSYKTFIEPKTSNDAGAVAQIPIQDDIAVSKDNLKLYLEAWCGEWKKLNEVDTTNTEQEELKNRIFNSMDNNTIRLNIYRHCKSLYDKWIGGSTGNIMTTCGTSKKTIDIATATKDRKSGSEPRLIDSFRFVSRAFNDIGDKYLINPNVIGDIILGNMNQSFYDLISRVLSDNNFNFIALPAYIDYNNTNEMESLFKAEIYNDKLSEAVSGPTFVCVYVGQSSNKLDLGGDSDFPNDGFDFRCDKNGNLEAGEGKLPNDFTRTKEDYEHNVVAFAVNYGHQNQNIFSDIKLDQQEFAETDESLQITDAIANNGSQSNRTQAGQNLWNVYQVRSYSTEIKALGNSMIQPMMYFQLNNIPMFHGAYMIINTKHKVVPNHMTTTFKGVRTRHSKTPLVDSNTLYMSMLGTLSDVEGFTSFDSTAFRNTTGLASDLFPVDATQVSELGFVSVYPQGTSFTVTSNVGPRSAQDGASKIHQGLDIVPKDDVSGNFLAPNGDTSIVWSSGYDFTDAERDSKGRPKVNVPILAGANAEVFGLRVSPSVGIILDVIVDNTYDNKGYVMRYMHILDVADKIVEAAGKKAGFTLDDWKKNNISGDLRVGNLGVKVKLGEVIGLTGGQRKIRKFGSTDTAGPYSSGPHLHLELLEFDGDNFDRGKITGCVSCRRIDYANKEGLTAEIKDYKSFLSDGSSGSFASNQKKQDEEGNAT